MFSYFVGALPHFILYFGVSVLLTLAFLYSYTRITPMDELGLIKEGITAPAISLIGTFLGFIIPLSIVIANSVSIPDLIMWGIVVAFVQLVVFFVVSKIFSGISEKLNEGCVASGVFLAGSSIAVGVLNAACMVP